MASAVAQIRPGTGDAPDRYAGALASAEMLFERARETVRDLVAPDGRTEAALLEREQHATHGLAWLATYVEALRQIGAWGQRLEGEGRLGELEALMVQAAFGEYLARIAGGLPMGQGETVRPHDLGLGDDALDAFLSAPVRALIRDGNSSATRARIAALIEHETFGDWGLDEDLTLVREQFRRFADERVAPFAHGWHERDELIPMDVIDQLAKLGVFGLTVPEEFGGLGLSKQAMCVVTEELSRGYIGVGSLGTRTEIAAELIRMAGTDEQKQRWLPGLASGAVIPTAVLT